jgi:PhzF family phenazine biosynthesis protein
MTARTYEFVQLDVFTRTPLTGNPLVVFTDARGLTDKEMQALAREMNLSESWRRRCPTAHPSTASPNKGAAPELDGFKPSI